MGTEVIDGIWTLLSIFVLIIVAIVVILE